MEAQLTTLLGQFKHRQVRDLAWVIASPPLVSGTIFKETENETHWWSEEDCLAEFYDCLLALHVLDREPSALINHLLALKNSRLGSIFEGLVSFWLRISPNFNELHQNIQIIEDKHTFGEIDFIIENIHTSEIIHLEVAVKFYLGCEPYEDAYRWFGTNTKDQLGKKIDHLKNHQTQLSSLYPKQLKKHFSTPIDKKQCFIKGRLFYPELCDTPPSNLELAKNHLRGKWSYVDQQDATKDLVKINKTHWLADLNTTDIKGLGYVSSNIVSQIDRAECFVETKKEGEFATEAQRIFYLPKSFTFPKLL